MSTEGAQTFWRQTKNQAQAERKTYSSGGKRSRGLIFGPNGRGGKTHGAGFRRSPFLKLRECAFWEKKPFFPATSLSGFFLPARFSERAKFGHNIWAKYLVLELGSAEIRN